MCVHACDCVRMRVCIFACASVSECSCVCVRERERETDRQREREKERGKRKKKKPSDWSKAESTKLRKQQHKSEKFSCCRTDRVCGKSKSTRSDRNSICHKRQISIRVAPRVRTVTINPLQLSVAAESCRSIDFNQQISLWSVGLHVNKQ